jgi:hypothetical protein
MRMLGARNLARGASPRAAFRTFKPPVQVAQGLKASPDRTMAAIVNVRARSTDMNHPQRTNTLSRLTCAAAAMVTTTVIGLSIHALARNYEASGERLAAAQPALVALAVKH